MSIKGSYVSNELQPYFEKVKKIDKGQWNDFENEWFKAWEMFDSALSSLENGKRKLIRYGNQLGFTSHREARVSNNNEKVRKLLIELQENEQKITSREICEEEFERLIIRNVIINRQILEFIED